jgi:DNA mismatch repair protein MutS2
VGHYAVGDRVHVTQLGTGVVREVRNAGRYLIELKGRSVVVSAVQLEPAGPQRRQISRAPVATGPGPSRGSPPTLDLHGKTSVEAIELLDAFINDALLADSAEARVIHGRSGGRVKAAVHARLGQLPSVRGFRLDPRNAGVTIVRL